MIDLYTKTGRKIVQRTKDAVAEAALTTYGINQILVPLYASRGMTPSDLDLSFTGLPSVDSLEGAFEAGSAIAEAVEKKQRIAIIGDYDADGATSTACFLRALGSIGADVVYLVPDRKKGYGLSVELAEAAHELGAKMMITVDNGIVAYAGVDRAKALGMTVIITDHHLCGDKLPKADVIVNQNIPGSKFKGRYLAGVGVAYYVLSATRRALAKKNLPTFNMLQLADLVAIGTVGDVVPLDLTNRILVNSGIERMRSGFMSPGVDALLRVSGKLPMDMNTEAIGFQLAPRINASGRLATANTSIDLLACTDIDKAIILATELNTINSERKSMQRDMGQIADIMAVLGTSARNVMVVHNAEFNEGIVGLLASKIKETHAKPSAVFTTAEDGNFKGSFRSIPGVNVRDAIALVASRHPGLVLKFGGHAMAAGAAIQKDMHLLFEKAFDEAVTEIALPGAFNPELESDGSLPLGAMNLETAELLAKEHWGSGFPPPVFDDRFKVVSQRAIGTEKQHLKLTLERNGVNVDAIYFNQGEDLPAQAHLIYRPAINVWNEQKSLQLMIDSHVTALDLTHDNSPPPEQKETKKFKLKF